MDFGRQVGRENRAKRLQKWHRKNDEKMKDSKMTKKSNKEALTPLGPEEPRPRKGVGGGVKPLPEGRRERRSKRKETKTTQQGLLGLTKQ